MKLSTRLVLLFLVISITPIWITSYLAYLNGIQTIQNDTFDRLVAINDLKAAEVNRWVLSNRAQLQSMAQRPLVRKYTAELIDPDVPSERKQSLRTTLLKDHFRPTLGYHIGLLDLSILDAKYGKIIASSDQYLLGKFRFLHRFFQEGKRHTFVDQMAYEIGLEALVMHISTPIKDNNGCTLAVLSGHLNWQELSKIMAQGRKEQGTEESYLVNHSNYFITESRFVPGYPLKKTIYTKGVVDCLKKNDGADLYNDYRDVPIIGAYRWLDEWSVCLLTEEDQAEAFEPITKLRHLFVGIGSIIVCFVAFFSLLLTRTITRRIDMLVVGAQEIQKGNLDYRVNIPGKDELDVLAGSFNEMVKTRKQVEEKLQRSHDLLEDRVEKRTAELTSKNVLLHQEIEERKLAETALRESEKKYRSLLESLDTAVMVHDNDARVLIANRRVQELLGLEPTKLEGQILHAQTWKLTDINGSPLSLEDYPINTIVRTGHPIHDLIIGVILPDSGAQRWLSVNGYPEFDEKNEVRQIVISFWDISFRLQAEEKLQNSLNEKEILLREIHHRVKNNMQMIQSLINLQSNKFQNSDLKIALQGSNSRIKSMALIHETLYRSENLATLDLEQYFRQLVRHLLKLYNKARDSIEILYEIKPVQLDMDSSISCGLIVNELVTNVLKYAFIDTENNKLTISLEDVEGVIYLRVEDNGKGMPDVLQNLSGDTLGLKIVTMLAEDQLNGTIETDVTSGTKFEIRFPR